MAQVDTLKAYEDLIATGIPNEQAKAQVYVLNNSFEGVATKTDMLILEKDLKIFFTWEVGTLFLVAILLPMIARWLERYLDKPKHLAA